MYAIACMHSPLINLIYSVIIIYIKILNLGLSDGSGEDDVPQIGSNGGNRQFSDQRGVTVQQDMDYSSNNTLWSNSSR